MKKSFILALLTIFALVVASGCEVSTANLQNVKVCSDPDSDNQCPSDDSSFKSDVDEIFVSGDLENAPDGTELTITWNYLGEKEDDKTEEIDTVKLTTEDSSNVFHSNLKAPSGGWPAGDYEIVLDLGTDNSEPVTKKFSIKAADNPDLLSDLKVCDNPSNDECPSDMKSFTTDTPVIYLSGAIAEVPASSVITINWQYLGGEAGDEQDIDSVDLEATDTPNVFYSNLAAPDAGWPAGDYEIVLELDGKQEATKAFSVE